jgi:hypothetical protein
VGDDRKTFLIAGRLSGGMDFFHPAYSNKYRICDIGRYRGAWHPKTPVVIV